MKTGNIMLVAVFLALGVTTSRSQDPNWVKDNTWYFDNFTKDILPWSMFRETFIGVAPAPSADFDQIFYDAMYKDKLAAQGHCYGMDVMAVLMLKNGGHLGYCHSPKKYTGTIASPANPADSIGPADPNLKMAIGLVHGNQINHGFLSFMLDVIAISKSRDGRYASQQVDFYLAKNDPPVISVTKDISPADGGHVLIPFFTRNMGATRRIYVYDPNRSYYKPGPDGKDWYVNGENYIEVNNASGAWKFNMGTSGSPSFWSGSPGGGGGHCITIPVSVAGKRDRLPQSLLAEGAYALNTIFIHGIVRVEQISDSKGEKNFLNAKGNDLEPCEEKRLTTVLPFIPFDGGQHAKREKENAAYFFRGSDPVTLQYRAFGTYRIGMIFHGRYYEVTGRGTGEIQFFSAEEKFINPAIQPPRPLE